MQTQAYFEDIQPQILHELGRAKKSIHIAVAWFTDPELFSMLYQKVKDGLHVELVITNDRINANSGLDYDRLSSLGAIIKKIGSDGKKPHLMHNKFCVIDEETVINGSYNWTYMAQKHDENITVIREAPDLAAQFLAEFRQIFLKKKSGSDNVFDQGKLMARLEALRGVIHADDNDDIALQLLKLKKMLPTGFDCPDVRRVITHVENGDLDEAVSGIVAWLNINKQVSIWVDPEIYELKFELKSLEIQITAFEDEKSELEKQLNAFRFLYALELGELVQKILSLRMEALKNKVALDPSKHEEYEASKRDYDQFTNDFVESCKHDAFELTPELQKELKSMYRFCSKLCHPDVVAPEHLIDAQRLFSQLNEANKRNDFETINRIYLNLKKGIFVAASESICDAQKLQRAVLRLKAKLSELNTSIRVIRQSHSYRKLCAIADWDLYFINSRKELEAELKRLEINE